MKPDGVSMETTEPTEPSSSQDMTEQASSKVDKTANDAAPTTAPKTNGKPLTSESKVKPKAVASKTQHTGKSTGASVPNSRPGTASHRMLNDIKSSNNVSAAAVKKTSTTSSKASTSGAVPKRPLGVAGVSTTVKNQTRVPDKKSVGPTRTTSVAAATATNGTKPTPMNGASKKGPVAETVAMKPKTTATPSRMGGPKPSTLTSTKTRSTALLKTTRPATAPSTARPASTTPRGTAATAKASTNLAAKTSASRLTTAPSTGRTTAAQLSKSAAAKKDASQPPSATVAKKPTTGATSGATKKPEPSKVVATAKLNAVPKNSEVAKATEPKVSQPKTQSQPPTKKLVASTRFPATNKPLPGRTVPTSSVSKPANGGTPQAKRGNKPTQTVPPFTFVKKTGVLSAATLDGEAHSAAGAAVAAATAAAVLVATQADSPVASPQEPSLAAPVSEEVPSPQDTPPLVVPQEPEQSHVAVPTPPKSPVSAALPQIPSNQQLEIGPPLLTQEQIPHPAEPTSPPVASRPDQSDELAYLLSNQTPSTSKTLIAASNTIPQIIPPPNLNEEEDEEERERSQLVSMSEISGTTQATEESHPGSAGPVGGSAWRASGALLSELDSEDVSGSQQGASDFSTPGVMEGTESMDDLGDGSLKGAIDMEGASAGSPDSEKVPDIPVNDYDEEEDDDYDDNDHVCDMDVGSERTDELQRPRHDNDVDDEEEDEDVEMASEGVTESGLESYGNADEDDFAEDERLDNLNRVAQPPPPPPQLPAAPAAQWDQPNPFADYWAEPLQPQQVLQPVSQEEGAAAASPVVDPYQADSETPTQTTAQAWLEFGSASFVNENQDAPHHPSVQDEPQNVATPMYLDHPSPALMQTQAPAPLSATGMSLSSTLSSETSTPEELGDYKRDGKLQSQDAQVSMLSPQHNLDYQDLGFHENRDRELEVEEEAEAETLPADEVLGGPTTAPTSNPSSASLTEDEASDTEGEAQLDDSLDSPAVSNVTLEGQPPGQRCLSTVEEGEEAETEDAGAGEDTTPPSATSLASYGFDTMTTASNSNAQSTGESCIKSPGIFSLEELPEEAKEPCLIPEPLDQPCLAEQQYIECGKQGGDSGPVQEEVPGSQEDLSTLGTFQQPEENPDDIQAPYYSAICEKTENSFAGLNALPHPHRRDHAAYPRTYCDIVIPHGASVGPPKLTCADLPPRSRGQQALSPQLLRLEQHQRQLLEMQQRRGQQSKPLEEVGREEEQRKKKEEAEEEIKRNKEESRKRKPAEIAKKKEEEKVRKEQEQELKQRRDLELQLQQQQQELKQRQQIMQWQQELQQSNKGQTVLLSPSSGLCTIYEALENSEEEAEDAEQGIKKEEAKKEMSDQEAEDDCERMLSDEDKQRDSAVLAENPASHQDSPRTPSSPSQDGDSSSPPESPERPPPLDLDWGKKADIVQQLINQTLLLNGDSCSSLLLMPGGAGGTLSPLESSLWPSLLPPLTPPSATVTSVSSFSPEATGSSPQGEWTVVELETHH